MNQKNPWELESTVIDGKKHPTNEAGYRNRIK